VKTFTQREKNGQKVQYVGNSNMKEFEQKKHGCILFYLRFSMFFIVDPITTLTCHRKFLASMIVCFVSVFLMFTKYFFHVKLPQKVQIVLVQYIAGNYTGPQLSKTKLSAVPGSLPACF
jgi:hypothetical protein